MYALLQNFNVNKQNLKYLKKRLHVGSTSVRYPIYQKSQNWVQTFYIAENGLKETIQWYSRNHKYLTKAGNYIEKTFL